MKNSYIVEFIGTFFLVLTIGFAVRAGTGTEKIDSVLAPIAIGSILMTMIFAGGHISGAHYNPAVTLAVWIRGKCATTDVPFYMIAQVVAAGAAAYVVNFVKDGPHSSGAEFSDGLILKALIVEALFTFALAYVVLNVATAKATANNSFYGLAIGFTVLAGAVAVGSISSGAFNPAVAVGLGIMNLVKVEWIWIHLVADFAGGALAGVVFKILNPGDK